MLILGGYKFLILEDEENNIPWWPSRDKPPIPVMDSDIQLKVLRRSS
jgi:hypothetical protein